jgi:hypothetical protein
LLGQRFMDALCLLTENGKDGDFKATGVNQSAKTGLSKMLAHVGLHGLQRAVPPTTTTGINACEAEATHSTGIEVVGVW